MIKVEGHTNLYRDDESGAIINTDTTAYNDYVRSIETSDSRKRELDKIKSDIDEIKSLLKELVNKNVG
jgi:hypothetical protein|tara:strand:+ start:2310 stop:2513 length:204 start_codon:yes stop_codon:yes gene_type:complete